MEDPKIWDDPKRARNWARKGNRWKTLSSSWKPSITGVKDGRELFEMGRDDNDDNTLLAVKGRQRRAGNQARRARIPPHVQQSVPTRCPASWKSRRTAAPEAQDWASMLLRMYLKYGEKEARCEVMEE